MSIFLLIWITSKGSRLSVYELSSHTICSKLSKPSLLLASIGALSISSLWIEVDFLYLYWEWSSIMKYSSPRSTRWHGAMRRCDKYHGEPKTLAMSGLLSFSQSFFNLRTLSSGTWCSTSIKGHTIACSWWIMKFASLMKFSIRLYWAFVLFKISVLLEFL